MRGWQPFWLCAQFLSLYSRIAKVHVGITECAHAVRHISSVASTCLVRVHRSHCKQLLAALPTVRSLRHEAVSLRLLRVTGSARVAREVATKEHLERSTALSESLPRKVRIINSTTWCLARTCCFIAQQRVNMAVKEAF